MKKCVRYTKVVDRSVVTSEIITYLKCDTIKIILLGAFKLNFTFFVIVCFIASLVIL